MKLLAGLMASIFIFCSCQKEVDFEGNNVVVTPTSGKILLYVEDASNTPLASIDSFDVTYDASDRVTSLVSRNSGSRILYDYSAGSSYIHDIMDGSTLNIREINYINSSLQLVDSTLQYNEVFDSSTSKMNYNAANELTELKFYDYSYLTGAELTGRDVYAYDGAGNATTYTNYDGSGNVSSTTTVIYTSNNAVKLSIYPPYYPSLYKKLPQSETTVDAATSSSITINYTYTFDASNRLSVEVLSYGGLGFSVTRKYIYE